MKLISEENYLQHFGVPGMHWGKRKAAYITISKGNRNAKKAMRDARVESIKKDINSNRNDGTRITVRQANNHAKQAMKDARKESIHNDKEYNKAQFKKAANLIQKHGAKTMSDLKAWGKEAGQMTKNNYLHPIITSKANKESKKAEKTFGAKARRSAVYQNTNDLKDVNSRIDRMLAEKKKK